jgi:tetratricopeptide (TPR) repeat protein
MKLPCRLHARAALLLAVTLGLPAFASLPQPVADCLGSGRDRDAVRACLRPLTGAGQPPLVVAEAALELNEFAVANSAFRAAAAAAGGSDGAGVRVRWAALFHRVHQDADAEALLEEALALVPGHVEARVGLAAVYAGRFDARADALLDEVLAAEPAHARALALSAQLRLEDHALSDARALIERLAAAASGRGERIELAALRGSLAVLEGSGTAAGTSAAIAGAVAAAREIDPGSAAVHVRLAHFLAASRLYAEAVALLEQAVAVDAADAAAHAELGLNLLRVDRDADARVHLERAHALDRHDPRVVNLLRMLDQLDTYARVAGDGIVVRLPAAHAEAIGPLAVALGERALAAFAPRYGHRPPAPVVVTLHAHHEDFAVRTLGMPGLGILGATFGHVIAMDSPSARAGDGDFDWPSVLWHEIAHVFTLQASAHRVSRWFSEGTSVLEEWQHGPTPHRSLPLAFLRAYRDGRLLPIAGLDAGFVRPTYDDQVVVSYLQAGLACLYIERRFGTAALAGMLRAYRDGAGTEAAIAEALGVDAAAFDEGFGAFAAAELEALAANVDAMDAALATARGALADGQHAAALAAATTLRDLYPAQVGSASAYPLIAEAALALGRRDEALSALREYFRRGGVAAAVLARLPAIAPEHPEAPAVVERLALLQPLDADARARHGDALLAAGRAQEALREYRAHLGLGPHDRASAYLRLARAEHATGNATAARRAVLMALEIAPTYTPALQLLREIRGAGAPRATNTVDE